MRKLIFHTENETRDSIEERRLLENASRSPIERWHKAFQLMSLALLFKKGPIKSPEGLGIVLKRKVS